jgi:hypothetical protein
MAKLWPEPLDVLRWIQSQSPLAGPLMRLLIFVHRLRASSSSTQYECGEPDRRASPGCKDHLGIDDVKLETITDAADKPLSMQ